MRVRLLSRYAGPSGCHQSGDVIDVSATDAAGLIDGGYAVRVAEPAPAAPVEMVERAVVAPAETRAHGKRRRG